MQALQGSDHSSISWSPATHKGDLERVPSFRPRLVLAVWHLGNEPADENSLSIKQKGKQNQTRHYKGKSLSFHFLPGFQSNSPKYLLSPTKDTGIFLSPLLGSLSWIPLSRLTLSSEGGTPSSSSREGVNPSSPGRFLLTITGLWAGLAER